MDGNASLIVDQQNQQGEGESQVAAALEDYQSRCFLKESLPLGVGFNPSGAELLVRKVACEDTSTFDFYTLSPF
ncbi:unnamed protein product [Linum trigynum]|uniref:Uncharacterized protein n=1 Tax=Linum trigynum TaxID=586398 RepID=A0AAV2E3D5_9ROSI